MEDQLLRTAEAGDIDAFYSLIPSNPCILTKLDAVQFVETPLHVAASKGHTRFFIEIMRLMPSLASKLNRQGFSPLHMALTQSDGQFTQMVIRIIRVYPELVRVKSRQGVTPLHYAAETDNLCLISEFLAVCPSSITDLTTRGETALHVSARNGKIAASEVLMGWLERSFHQDVMDLEHRILNWQDDEGNTVLHIAAQRNDLQLAQLLSASGSVDINSTNFERETALDILDESQKNRAATTNSLLRQILISRGAKNGTALTSARSMELHDYLKLKITLFEQMVVYLFGGKSYKSGTARTGLLVVAVLVATATYNAGINPPGGVWSGVGPAHLVGTVVMNKSLFYIFQAFNATAFLASMTLIFLLLPSGIFLLLLQYSLIVCYMLSMVIISPTRLGRFTFALVLIVASLLLGLYFFSYLCYKRVFLLCIRMIAPASFEKWQQGSDVFKVAWSRRFIWSFCLVVFVAAGAVGILYYVLFSQHLPSQLKI